MASPNHLIKEKSPYLLQHAYNPVQWHPWGEAALAKARRENKLLLVSIGYATCHWCHVMEKESFEDPSIAGILNQHFVSIKVDREERPDVDAVYMKATHILGQQGGWPLNVFCTPAAIPFCIGTYFPPQDRYHLPSFKKVLTSISQMWQENSPNLIDRAQALRASLNKQNPSAKDGDIPKLAECRQYYYASLKQCFDEQDGGFIFQSQNKFPPSMHISTLLHLHALEPEENILPLAKKTLTAMKQGGIYDQVGGGLARYATDYKWRVPHFEKMLYDNALFALSLLETHQVTGDETYLAYAKDVLIYLLRDLKHPQGGFCCAEDADSEGEEGKFYVWSWEELQEILTPGQLSLAQDYFGVTSAGNFEGKNILIIAQSAAALAKKRQVALKDLLKDIESLRQVLFQHRDKRVRPLLDDKILTSWNALALTALAKMTWVTGLEEFLIPAIQTAEFILKELFPAKKGKREQLLRRYREGEAKHPAYLTDYATLARSYIDLYETTFARQWLNHAKELADLIQEHFFLSTDQGFGETDRRSEKLIAETVDAYDGVEPSGNSNAVWVFLKLSYYFDDDKYLKQAESILKAFGRELRQTISSPVMLAALAIYEKGFLEITLLGDTPAAWLREIQRHYLPHLVIAKISLEKPAPPLPLPQNKIKDWSNIDKPAVIICHRRSCSPPIYSLPELKKCLVSHLSKSI